MFDKSKLIILVTGTHIKPFDLNWKECERTWIPELRKLGFNVMLAFGVPSLNSPYIVDGDRIYFRTEDTKDGLVDKSIASPIKWILREGKYEYYMRIDSDSFVAPLRFEKMLNENFERFDDIDYMGCSIPVNHWWDNPPSVYFIQEEGTYASGAAYFVSKKAMIAANKKMKVTSLKELHCDDLVLGRALYESNIPLLHDGRIILHSKYNRGFFSEKVPEYDISEVSSHLAIQHYMNGHMDDAMIKLGYIKN